MKAIESGEISGRVILTHNAWLVMYGYDQTVEYVYYGNNVTEIIEQLQRSEDENEDLFDVVMIQRHPFYDFVDYA